MWIFIVTSKDVHTFVLLIHSSVQVQFAGDKLE